MEVVRRDELDVPERVTFTYPDMSMCMQSIQHITRRPTVVALGTMTRIGRQRRKLLCRRVGVKPTVHRGMRDLRRLMNGTVHDSCLSYVDVKHCYSGVPKGHFLS